MTINVERAVQRNMDRWAWALGLGKWRITWEVRDDPITRDDAIAHNKYVKRRTGYQKAHVKFSRGALTTPMKIERAVIHELLHIFDHGIGNDAHKLIDRLERPLIRVRRRLSRRER